MTSVIRSEISEFAKTVKVGDVVGIYEQPWGDRMIYSDTVKRVTPTGRIVLENGAVFNPDGFKRCQVYRNRFIGAVKK